MELCLRASSITACEMIIKEMNVRRLSVVENNDTEVKRTNHNLNNNEDCVNKNEDNVNNDSENNNCVTAADLDLYIWGALGKQKGIRHKSRHYTRDTLFY